MKRDREAWHSEVRGVEKGQTRLGNWTAAEITCSCCWYVGRYCRDKYMCPPEKSPDWQRDQCNNADVINAGSYAQSYYRCRNRGWQKPRAEGESFNPRVWEVALHLQIVLHELSPNGQVENTRLTNEQNHKHRSYQDQKVEHRGKDDCLGFVTRKCIWVKAWRVNGFSWWLRW